MRKFSGKTPSAILTLNLSTQHETGPFITGSHNTKQSDREGKYLFLQIQVNYCKWKVRSFSDTNCSKLSDHKGKLTYVIFSEHWEMSHLAFKHTLEREIECIYHSDINSSQAS